MFSMRLENEYGTIVDINDGIKFLVVAASGLTPPQATIFTSSSPNKKGSKRTGSTIEERSMNITIKILGDIEANRNYLYDWITSEQYTKIYYQNDIKNVYCEGYVEVPNINLFDSNELVELAITCPDPYWKNLQDVQIEITYLLKQFTFPFAIKQTSVVEVPVKTLYVDIDGVEHWYDATASMNEGMTFSTIKDNVNTSVYNSGTETGLLFTARFLTDITGFTIENANDVTQKIEFKSDFTFSAGDVLYIDTDNSPRTIKRINSNGEEENILKYVEGKPFWFTLKRGNNIFSYISSNNSAIELTITFSNKYLGV